VEKLDPWSKNLLLLLVVFAIVDLVMRRNSAGVLLYLGFLGIIMAVYFLPKWPAIIVGGATFGMLAEVFDMLTMAGGWYWPSVLVYSLIGGVFSTFLWWRRSRYLHK
jgi:hypothetical protein